MPDFEHFKDGDITYDVSDAQARGHIGTDLTALAGIHGLRYRDGVLSYYDETELDWVKIQTEPIFQGATSSADGVVGLVPVSLISNRSEFLRGDGTWGTPASTKIWMGTCSTAGSTQKKEATVGNGFTLTDGVRVGIKFTNTNTFESSTATPITLNVNSTGDINIYYNTTHSGAGNTGKNTVIYGYANRYNYYIYDGTYWVWDGIGQEVDTTYTPQKLGFGYGTCSTVEATEAKTATLASYELVKNGYVSVKFTNAVPASATLNVNSKGAKPIFYHGSAITAGIINAGDMATFVYDGTNYNLVGVDNVSSEIQALTDKAYQTDDTAETNISDGDYFPYYDTSANSKKKSLWSNIIAKIKAALGIESSGDTYLKKDGTWGTPTNTTYGVVSKTANGLAPQLPNETTTTKYLRQDGTWQVPPDNNTTYSAGTGLGLSGTSFYIPISRVAESANALPGVASLRFREYTAGANYNLPSNAWYQILEIRSQDTNYGTQLALGMTVDAAYYRKYSGGSWGSWKSLIDTNTNTWRGIQDNLTSDSTTDSLSAKQGKALKSAVDEKAPTSHASTGTGYGAGNASNYGHVKVSDNYTSSAGNASQSVAASSKAVNDCYNTLNGNKVNILGTNKQIAVEGVWSANSWGSCEFTAYVPNNTSKTISVVQALYTTNNASNNVSVTIGLRNEYQITFKTTTTAAAGHKAYVAFKLT